MVNKNEEDEFPEEEDELEDLEEFPRKTPLIQGTTNRSQKKMRPSIIPEIKRDIRRETKSSVSNQNTQAEPEKTDRYSVYYQPEVLAIIDSENNEQVALGFTSQGEAMALCKLLNQGEEIRKNTYVS